MNAISTQTLSGKASGKRLYRLTQCLIILGAKREDVYTKHNRPTNGKPRNGNINIYQRYEPFELRRMVEKLYRQGMKQYHPDKHDGNPVMEERCQELGRAYHRAKKILSRK